MDLFATDFPAEEILAEAFEQVTPEEARSLVDEIAWLCPGLRDLPLKEAFMKLMLLIMLIYLVLPFGFSGSPGKFGVLAVLPELAKQSAAPSETRTNG